MLHLSATSPRSSLYVKYVVSCGCLDIIWRNGLNQDYAIAMYPLVVIIFIYYYLLIKLHKWLEMIQFLWRPTARLFTRVSKQWKTSSNRNSTSTYSIF